MDKGDSMAKKSKSGVDTTFTGAFPVPGQTAARGDYGGDTGQTLGSHKQTRGGGWNAIDYKTRDGGLTKGKKTKMDTTFKTAYKFRGGPGEERPGE
jgi:hypothetical protein